MPVWRRSKSKCFSLGMRIETLGWNTESEIKAGGGGGLRTKEYRQESAKEGRADYCMKRSQSAVITENSLRMPLPVSSPAFITVLFLKNVRRDQTRESEVDIKAIKRDKSSPSIGRECDLERAEREAEEKINKMRKTRYDLDRKKLADKRQKVALRPIRKFCWYKPKDFTFY